MGVLVSLAVLPVLGVCDLFLGKQLHDGWLWRRRPTVDVANVGPTGEHRRSIDVRSICKPSVCDRYAAPGPRKMMPQILAC